MHGIINRQYQHYPESHTCSNKLEDDNIEKLSKLKTMISFVFVALFFLSLSPTATPYREVEDEREFSYDPYSTIGPAFWGQIHPEWFLCGNGSRQSPINLKSATSISRLRDLEAVYRPSFSTLVNRGHDISLRWGGNPGYIQINKTRYYLDQCHWHTPAEHTIKGKRYDLEIHCVHESNTGRISVIAVLYKVGPLPDPFLTLLTVPLKTLANGALEAPAGVKDPSQIQLSFTQYYRYIGSLTTPPCTENIVWTVSNQINSVSRAQVKLLQKATGDGTGYNARPLQPLNNRTVLLYKPFILEAMTEIDNLGQLIQSA